MTNSSSALLYPESSITVFSFFSNMSVLYVALLSVLKQIFSNMQPLSESRHKGEFLLLIAYIFVIKKKLAES